MDDVTLMNRVETKYVFSSSRLSGLLSMLPSHYKVLEIEKERCLRYTTTYFDTPDFQLFDQQMRGKLNRHKIRYRCYEVSGHTFLEIKKKTNKKRTVKRRIENYLNGEFNNEALTFLEDNFPDMAAGLTPALINVFTRVTLVGNDMKERITVDSNLSFRSPEGNSIELPYLAIAEVKKEKHNSGSPFFNLMKEMGIQPNNFSKYSIGSSLIRTMPRINTLKPNLLLIKKLENEYLKLA
jgi:hypothetical protein